MLHPGGLGSDTRIRILVGEIKPMISNQITEILTPRGCSRITGTPPITLNLWSHAHAWVFSPQYDEETKTTRAWLAMKEMSD